MPAALKSYVLNLTTEVRRCVNDWESCGSFELNDAMQRLFGACTSPNRIPRPIPLAEDQGEYVGGMFADSSFRFPLLLSRRFRT